MNNTFFSAHNLSLIKCNSFSAWQLLDVISLYSKCSRHDAYSYDSYIDAEEVLPNTYYLCYVKEADANTSLIGFLAILIEDEECASMNGYIHPDFRNRHIFTEMVRTALADAFHQSAVTLSTAATSLSETSTAATPLSETSTVATPMSVKYMEYHLPDEPAVPSFVISLLSKLGFRFSHHEYYMHCNLSSNTLCETANASSNKLTASPSNAAEPAKNNLNLYDSSDDASSLHITCDTKEEDLLLSIFLDSDMIGSARLFLPEDHKVLTDCPRVFFHAFEIKESYRHKGYGRQSFLLILQLLRQQNCHKLALHVSGLNKTAHRLYVSCGLEVTSSFSMYLYP